MWDAILKALITEIETHPDQVFALIQDIVGLLKQLPVAQLSQAASVLLTPKP